MKQAKDYLKEVDKEVPDEPISKDSGKDETFKKVTSNINKTKIDNEKDNEISSSQKIDGEQENDMLQSGEVDVSLNTFSNKLKYISTYLIERGYDEIKSFIEDGYGNIELATEKKFQKSDFSILKELSTKLKIKIEITNTKIKNSTSVNYNIKVENILSYEDYVEIYAELEAKRLEKEDLIAQQQGMM